MFIGRKQELESIKQRTSYEKFHLLEISGLPGVGKTVLIQEFQMRNMNDSLCCNLSLNPAQEQNYALGSLILQMVDNIQEHQIDQLIPTNYLRLWGSLCPELMKKYSESPSVLAIKNNGYDLNSKVEIFYEILLNYQQIIDEPFAIWIDDFQHLDTESFMVFERLIPMLEKREFPVLWVVSFRSKEEIPFAERWEQVKSEIKQKSETLLKPFTLQETEQLANSLLTVEFSSQQKEFVQNIHEKTNGNPFLIKQILQRCRDKGIIECRFDGWVVHNTERDEIYQTWTELLIHGLSDFLPLYTESRYVLYFVQVAKRWITPDLLIRLYPERQDNVQDLFSRLFRAGILQKKTEGEHIRYLFSHPLWYDIELDFLLPQEKERFLLEIIQNSLEQSAEEMLLPVQCAIEMFKISKKISSKTKKMLRQTISSLKKKENFNSLISVCDLLLSVEKSEKMIAKYRYEQILAFEQIDDIQNIIKHGANLNFHLLPKTKRKRFFALYIRMIEKSSEKETTLERYGSLLSSPQLKPEERINILFEEIHFLTDAEEIEKAQQALNEAERIEHTDEYFAIKLRIFQKIIELHRSKDLMKTLAKLEDLVNQNSKRLKREDKFYFYNTLMIYYKNNSQPQKAIEYEDLKQKNFLIPQSRAEEIFAKTQRATYFMMAGKFQESVEILETVATYYESINSIPNYCTAVANLGMCYFCLEQFPQTIAVLEKGLPTFRKSEIPAHYFYGYNNLGAAYSMTFQSDKAINILEELKSKVPESNEMIQYHIEYNLAMAYSIQVRTPKQVRNALKSFLWVKEFFIRQQISEEKVYQIQIIIATMYCYLHWKQKARALYLEVIKKFPPKTLSIETAEQKEFALTLTMLAILMKDEESAGTLRKIIEPIDQPLLISQIKLTMALYAERIEKDKNLASDWILQSAISGIENGQIGMPNYLQAHFPWFTLEDAILTKNSEVLLQWAGFLVKQYPENEKIWQFFHLKMTQKEFQSYVKTELSRLRLIFKNGEDYEDFSEIIQPLSLDLINNGKQIEFRCFGEFEILIGGKPLQDSFWKSKLGQKMLAYLVNALVAGKSSVAKKDLVSEMWYDLEDPKKIDASFRAILSKLRKQIAQITPDMQWIISQRGNLGLNPALSIKIDTIEFSKQIAKGKAAQLSDDMEHAMQCYESAIAIYKGAYLRNFAEDWNEGMRMRFADEFVDAIQFVIEYFRKANDDTMRHHFEYLLKKRDR